MNTRLNPQVLIPVVALPALMAASMAAKVKAQQNTAGVAWCMGQFKTLVVLKAARLAETDKGPGLSPVMVAIDNVFC